MLHAIIHSRFLLEPEAFMENNSSDKKGWKTSEFWVGLVAALLTFAGPWISEQLSKAPDGSWAAAIGPAVLGGAYIFARGQAKKDVPPAAQQALIDSSAKQLATTVINDHLQSQIAGIVTGPALQAMQTFPAQYIGPDRRLSEPGVIAGVPMAAGAALLGAGVTFLDHEVDEFQPLVAEGIGQPVAQTWPAEGVPSE